jgi:hypothetical protein
MGVQLIDDQPNWIAVTTVASATANRHRSGSSTRILVKDLTFGAAHDQ